MKAAVCYTFGEPLQVVDVTLDAPRAEEVKVRVAATAVCHSDVHLIRGEWSGATPIVAGHEAAGVVEEVGEDVTHVKPGDRVVVSLVRSCGLCAQCARGALHNCEGVFAIDSESRMHDVEGRAMQHGGIKTTAFAEQTIVHQSQVVPIPDSMPFDRAALIGCGVITGIGAVLNTAQVPAGASVVVIGAGGVGLNAIQGAVLAGAASITAIDRLDAKLEAATRFGATRTTMDPKSVRGVDYAFVAVGSPEAVVDALRMIRRGGTVVVVGMPGVRTTAQVRVFDLVWSEQRLMGSRMGGTSLHEDVPRYVALYLDGRLKLDELITARYSLDGINEAIEVMEKGEALRNVIVFS
ncbi:MAG TPA: alcohol dehydrogenase catalytic domain-containing protein [Thermoanaerobaculia bacterium]|nr:alcohol dehydrogenase catalytic domain-containing protein [Thermoanaerobaculia bacterium]